MKPCLAGDRNTQCGKKTDEKRRENTEKLDGVGSEML